MGVTIVVKRVAQQVIAAGRRGAKGDKGDPGEVGGIPYATAAPQPLGNAAALGAENTVARGDHVHVKPTPADIGAEVAGTTASAITAHEGAADPHSQYLNQTRGDARYVVQEVGKGLSSNDYTTAEKDKLAGLESSRFKGEFVSLAALQTAYPTASVGDYANVDAGTGSTVQRYVWDSSDAAWILVQGQSTQMTAAEVKTAYESNADTNAFTDSEKTKLGGIAAGATANANTDELAEGATNQYHTAARVRGTLLDGLSTTTTTVIAATDSVLTAIGKLAGRLELAFSRANHTGTQAISTIDNLQTALDGKMTNPMTAAGDLLVGGTGGAPARLAKGADGQVLKLVSGAPAWATDETGGGSGGDMLSALLSAEVSVSAAAALDSSAFGKMHVCSGSANYTVTLPAATGNAGKLIGFRMSGGLSALVTIDGNGAELVDGQQTRVMWKNEAAILLCDGTGWTKIAGKSIPFRAKIRTATTQSLPSGVTTVVALPSVEYTSATMTATANALEVQRGGSYFVHAHTPIDPNSSPRIYMGARRDGTNDYLAVDEVAGNGSLYNRLNASTVVELTAGNLLRIAAYHTTGDALSTHYNAANPGFLALEELPKW